MLTNFDVLNFLKTKGASKDLARVLANVAPSEYKVVMIFIFPLLIPFFISIVVRIDVLFISLV